jgi:hypothetical protein
MLFRRMTGLALLAALLVSVVAAVPLRAAGKGSSEKHRYIVSA